MRTLGLISVQEEEEAVGILRELQHPDRAVVGAASASVSVAATGNGKLN